MTCPHCSSTKVVKNGIRPNKNQNYLCHSCNRQFQENYIYRACIPEVQRSIIDHVTHNCGVRDTAVLCKVSAKSVLKQVLKKTKSLGLQEPDDMVYESIQVDECWSYVGAKKKKRFLVHAYDPKSRKTLAVVFGKRDIHTAKRLLKALEKFNILEICTDAWEAFINVFKDYNHKVGKQFTKAIEGLHTAYRNRCKRLNRKTTGYSKVIEYHDAFILLMIWNRNRKQKDHH